MTSYGEAKQYADNPRVILLVKGVLASSDQEQIHISENLSILS
jgi:hypothetical protein